MNNDIAEIRSLDTLLNSLYTIISNENYSDTRYAEQRIKLMRNNIQIALSEAPDSYCDLFLNLKAEYSSMFPPKGGLTEFCIWRNDFALRQKLNSDYQNIQSQIKAILDRH